ncbi:tRNA (adenosine(37)-N6)-threonylcarbamoyltransferase complex transferase subunit TsaD [Candidatus Magnetobacterium casense]|uniref:tRNA N6-adenosine threonylcarbamoyltransferase n=1 Tax=Candidatus Magnetobacterium casense TaxID=1455061 RepID=A0ABS6RXN7_9BACT|nr:tRNA (adenosine(37)-N6)-threonylcarbamoyltransferase complex transferase subunit TsaD [Candidatus Magnetobacterium casensis]MBV6341383.1 tRNA (adenosine(37)-N6)-threonylcarbamoyltransferase complex transferase subunit TsaD [Candidatus Magnetobacterium casensis]
MSDVGCLILAIDTSCDDTSAAVVRDGRDVLSNVVSNQSAFHSKYGGIVPEIASRRHVEQIWPVVDAAMQEAQVGFGDLSAVAVCHGPGLIGSLIVGCAFAKSVAYACGLALIGVNHLHGHICSVNLIEERPLKFPYLSLVVSGGHTSMYRVDGDGLYTLVGATRDDAAGEAYDKVARMLGLGYPGGPVIDALAKDGNPKAINFPRAYMPDSLDFSFSGLKTSVMNYLRTSREKAPVEDICASFQAAVIDCLLRKVQQALNSQRASAVTITGGVAANDALRRAIRTLPPEIEAIIPPKTLCTDNAAMIAAAAYISLKKGEFANLTLNPKAYIPVC